VVKRTIFLVAEIQVNHKWLGPERMGLLDPVHWSSLVVEDVGMYKVKVLGIFLVRDIVFATRLTGNCGRALISTMDAVLLKKLSESCARCHCTFTGYYVSTQFLGQLIAVIR